MLDLDYTFRISGPLKRLLCSLQQHTFTQFLPDPLAAFNFFFLTWLAIVFAVRFRRAYQYWQLKNQAVTADYIEQVKLKEESDKHVKFSTERICLVVDWTKGKRHRHPISKRLKRKSQSDEGALNRKSSIRVPSSADIEMIDDERIPEEDLDIGHELFPSTSAQLMSSIPLHRHPPQFLSMSMDDLRHVPHELHGYRQRIDANVEEQRRHRQMLEKLHDKLQKYRLKMATDIAAREFESTMQVPSFSPLSISKHLSGSEGQALAATGTFRFPSAEIQLPSMASTEYLVSIPSSSSFQPSSAYLSVVDPIWATGTSNIRPVSRDETGEIQRMRGNRFTSMPMLENLGKGEEITRHSILGRTISTLSERLQFLQIEKQKLDEEVHAAKEEAHHARKRLNNTTMQYEEEKFHRERRNERNAEFLHRMMHKLWLECGHLKRHVKNTKMEVERDLGLQKNELLLSATSLNRQIKSKRTEQQKLAEERQKAQVKALENIELENIKLKADNTEQAKNALKAREERQVFEELLQKIWQLIETRQSRQTATKSRPPTAGSISPRSPKKEAFPEQRTRSLSPQYFTSTRPPIQPSFISSFVGEKTSVHGFNILNSLYSLFAGIDHEVSVLLSEIKRYEGEVSDLQQKLDSTTAKISEFKVSLLSKQKDSQQIQLEKERLEGECMKFRLQIENRNNECDQLQAALRQHLKDHECQQTRFQQTIDELISKTEKMDFDKRVFEQREKDLGVKLELAHEERIKLKGELNALLSEKQEGQKKVEELNELKLCSDEKRRELQRLQDEISDKESSYNIEIKELRTQNKNLTDKLHGQHSEHTQYIFESAKHRAELEEKVFSLQKLLQETKVGLNKMREENEKIKSFELAMEKSLLNEQQTLELLSTLQLQYDAISKENQQKSIELSEIRQKVNDMEVDRGVEYTNYEHMKAANMKQLKELELTKERVRELQEHIRMAKEIRIGEDQRFEKLLDNERQKLQSEYAKQVALDIEEKEQQLTEAKQSLAKLREEHNLTVEELCTIRVKTGKSGEENKAAIHRLQSQLMTCIEEHAAEIRHRNEAEAGLRDEKERQSRELARLKCMAKEAEEREAEHGEKLADAELRLETGAMMIQKLHNDLRELCEQNMAQKLEATTRQSKLQADLSDLSDELTLTQSDLKRQQSKCSELERELSLIENGREKTVRELSKVEYDLKSAKEDTTMKDHRIQRLELEVAEVKYELESVRARSIGDKEEVQRLKRENEDHKRQQKDARADKETQIARLRSELAVVRANLDEDVQRNQKQEMEMNRMKEEKKQKEAEYDTLQKEHQSCAERIHYVEGLILEREHSMAEMLSRERLNYETALRKESEHFETISKQLGSANQKEVRELNEKLRENERNFEKLYNLLAPFGSTTKENDFQSLESFKPGTSASEQRLFTAAEIHRGPHGDRESLVVVNFERIFQMLKTRIEQNAIEQENSHRTTALLEQAYREKFRSEEEVRRMEGILSTLKDEKQQLEAKLAKFDQIYHSEKEKIILALESEKRGLEDKLRSEETHRKERDLLIKQLQTFQNKIETEKRNLADELNRSRSNERLLSNDKTHLKSHLTEAEKSVQKLTEERNELIRKNKTITTKLAQTEKTAELAQREGDNMSQLLKDHQKEMFERLAKEEKHLRQSSAMKKLESQYEDSKLELEKMTERWRNAEREHARTRNELLDVEKRSSDASLKVIELQKQMTAIEIERKRELASSDPFKTREGEWRAIESRLKMELEQINSQMRRLTREIEELKRQNKVLDITKGELESQIMTFKKENESHQRHIEALEMDKHRFNAIIRQTTLERNALEKSLDKMERENTELVLQIGRLQSQISNMDQGPTTSTFKRMPKSGTNKR